MQVKTLYRKTRNICFRLEILDAISMLLGTLCVCFLDIVYICIKYEGNETNLRLTNMLTMYILSLISNICNAYLQNFHMDTRGWWDIGYNFLIGEDGRAYVGRGWDTLGAHAKGFNQQSIGKSIIENN